ncbi:MAG: CDP-archaeol synthase [Patescibacteria group bacterium]
MKELILSALYFALPAYLANMAPIIFAKIPFTKIAFPLGKPINEKAFGAHKTWRGFYVGYLAALLILLLQFYLQKNDFVTQINLLNYKEINLFMYAFLFGVGAITGDLIKSFFKRRIGIKPGGAWFPFDQLDFIFGFLLFISPFYFPPTEVIIILLIATPLLHFLTNLSGYLLGLKKVWW